MKTIRYAFRNILVLGLLITGNFSCDEKKSAQSPALSPSLRVHPEIPGTDHQPPSPWAPHARTVVDRASIRSSSPSPDGRLETARNILKTMSGRDAKDASAILTDMVCLDLLSNAEPGADGEEIIIVSDHHLRMVEDSYQHLARIAPKEAAIVLETFPAEIGEHLMRQWLANKPGLDERILREFQSGLDNDAAAGLPWRLAKEWATAYGEDAALEHLQAISGFLPATPADMVARMRNTLAVGQ